MLNNDNNDDGQRAWHTRTDEGIRLGEGARERSRACPRWRKDGING